MSYSDRFSSAILDLGLVAILRGVPDGQLEAVALALAESGIKLIEVALSDRAALRQIGILRSLVPEDVIVGAGTVISRELAVAAAEQGATFLVTPHVSEPVIGHAVENDLGLLCGAMTPTEIMHAVDLGARFIKLFPASQLGAGYVKQLLGPFPQLKLFPTGGIGSGNLAEFLEAGAKGAGVGGRLSRGSTDEIRREALKLRTIIVERAPQGFAGPLS